MRALSALERDIDRSVLWALRETGRRAAAAARAAAPVYTGDRPDIPRGRLRRSIKPARRILVDGDGTKTLRVGPTGWPATGYAGQQEARAHYMKAGHRAAAGALSAVMTEAATRATTVKR